MSFKHFTLLATLFSALPAWCGHTLTQQQQKILDAWLSQRPSYRAATDPDCNCSDDIQQMRTGYGGNWTPYPDYHPYAVVLDFNGDGATDFAVVVIDRSKSANAFTLLIFNGPFGSKPTAPAYVESRLDLSGQGMSLVDHGRNLIGLLSDLLRATIRGFWFRRDTPIKCR